MRELARRLNPKLLVTASHAGDASLDDLREYVEVVDMHFISPHRPRQAGSPSQTEAQTRLYLDRLKQLRRVVPVHYQEPFRRGFGKWNPQAEDFVTDLRAAVAGGAAGWCFHNGDARDQPEGRPRRSFDLRAQRLFDQFDEQERKAVELLETVAKQGSSVP